MVQAFHSSFLILSLFHSCGTGISFFLSYSFPLSFLWYRHFILPFLFFPSFIPVVQAFHSSFLNLSLFHSCNTGISFFLSYSFPWYENFSSFFPQLGPSWRLCRLLCKTFNGHALTPPVISPTESAQVDPGGYEGSEVVEPAEVWGGTDEDHRGPSPWAISSRRLGTRGRVPRLRHV